MLLFGKKRTAAPAPLIQLRSGEGHPFSGLAAYAPLSGGDTRLYRSIREAVPIIDAAIVKLIRLTGGFSVRCESGEAQRAMDEFIRTVPTGRGQRGLQAFLDCYLDSMFVCGRAVGEIVLWGGAEAVAAVLCGRVEDVELKEGASPLEFSVCRAGGLEPQPLPYQELILFTPLNPETDSPYGVSLLRSMPFMSDILLKIYSSVGMNWERAGNLRYSVVYKPAADGSDRALLRERGEAIAREWSQAMAQSKNGSVRDFVAVGDVEIKVIGADGQILDCETPVRQLLEQLVARTGIPPAMLGLSWSSTERMTAQQADILTSEITAVRRSVAPVLERICECFLACGGYRGGARVVWDDINLQDAVEEARAELYRAQAGAIGRGEEGSEKK